MALLKEKKNYLNLRCVEQYGKQKCGKPFTFSCRLQKPVHFRGKKVIDVFRNQSMVFDFVSIGHTYGPSLPK